MSALLNAQDHILLLSPVEEKNTSELRASLTNQTPSILPHHWSCPPAYGVQLVPSLIWRSVLLLPTHFVFPMNLAVLNSSLPRMPRGTSFGSLKTHFQSSFQPHSSTSNIIWHSTEMMMFSLETGGEITTEAGDEALFNSLWGLCCRSLQWSSTFTPTPAMVTVTSSILEGFYEWWVWYCLLKTHFQNPLRKTTQIKSIWRWFLLKKKKN